MSTSKLANINNYSYQNRIRRISLTLHICVFWISANNMGVKGLVKILTRIIELNIFLENQKPWQEAR